jgi:hypothetical protein
MSDLRSVDDTDHAVLAVLALAAVEPDGSRGVCDFVGEGGAGDLLGVGSRHEAGPEAALHGLAGVGKGGLGNGVVLGPELESDHVTLGRLDAVGLEDQVASLVTNGNGVLLGESGASHGGSSEDGGEMHYDWFVGKRD